ncbi:hypothetical protein DVH05_011478 [Phytophthora capsici]|nr:hypothetical protein DVH05_011478 [Phytophthora capsici]
MWHSRAVVNCEERVRSERVNQELKDILSQQSKMFDSFRKVLQRVDAARDIEFVSQPLPTVDRPFFEIDYSGQNLAELARNVDQFYSKMDVGASTYNAEEYSVTFRCQSKPVADGGEQCFNITMRTPLVCSVTEARDILWDYVTEKENPDIRKSFNFARARSPSKGEAQSDHRNCITALFIPASSKDSPSFVNALGTYWIFERAGRVFLVGGMRWLLPAEGLDFEDNYCTSIDPLENGSVVRTFYQLRSQNAKTIPGIPNGMEEKVMNCIAGKSRHYLQSMQNALLDRTLPFTTLPSI